MTPARILIVEDESIVSELLQEYLQGLGHTICAVTAYGEDAVEKAAELTPDLILMDIMLKGEMNGVEAAALIRERHHIPVVYLSAYSDEKILQSAKETEPFGYIQKPFKTLDIRSAIEIALYRARIEKELHKANLELEKSYIKLENRKLYIESILSNLQSGIIVTDPDLRIKLANPYVLNIYGRSAEEAAGKSLAEFCPEIYENIIEETNTAEIAISSGSDGLVVGFNRSDLKGINGSIDGHIITFKDLTETMRIRREMRKKERLSTMGEVVARVAHEMRNPLFAITATAQILSMELKLTPDQKELMGSLFSEARRLNNLVEELLDCSKEIRLQKSSFDIMQTVENALSIDKVFIMEKRLEIRKETLDGEVVVFADQEKIKQVLINIIKNAVDANPAGGVIGISFEMLDGEVSIHITDTGPGIPEEDMEKIFEVFYTTKRHGTGLGLPICKKIVEAHGGLLTAANNAVGGATFTFTIPIEGIAS